jgi:hypothetical protein
MGGEEEEKKKKRKKILWWCVEFISKVVTLWSRTFSSLIKRKWEAFERSEDCLRKKDKILNQFFSYSI